MFVRKKLERPSQPFSLFPLLGQAHLVPSARARDNDPTAAHPSPSLFLPLPCGPKLSAPTPSFFPVLESRLAGDGATVFNPAIKAAISCHSVSYKEAPTPSFFSPKIPDESCPQAARIARRSSASPSPSSTPFRRVQDSQPLSCCPFAVPCRGAPLKPHLSFSCAAETSLHGARRSEPQQPRLPTAGSLPRQRRHPHRPCLVTRRRFLFVPSPEDPRSTIDVPRLSQRRRDAIFPVRSPSCSYYTSSSRTVICQQTRFVQLASAAHTHALARGRGFELASAQRAFSFFLRLTGRPH